MAKLFGTPFKKGYIPWNTGRAFGLYGTPFYKTWINMKTRCYNPKGSDFHRYGNRGIKVCEEWQEFSGFYKDMFSSYKKGLTLDRIDNNGNYSKENCRWATRKIQALNTRNVERAKRYKFGKFNLTIRELAEIVGIKRSTLDARLNIYKWPFEKAIGGVSLGR